MTDQRLIPEFFSNFELERQLSISFSRDNETFEKKTKYLMVSANVKDDTVTPKFVQSATFEETLQDLAKDMQEENIGRTSVIKSKKNCLADFPDLHEFYSMNKERIASANCKCLLF